MASRSVNKVILLGHLGKDAETKFTPNGVAKSTFSLATNRRWQDKQTNEWKEITDWHNIVLWRSENLANFLQKGKQVYIEGRIENRSWEDKEGQKRYITEIVCDELILLGGRGDSGGGSMGDYSQPPVSMPRSARPSQAPPPLPRRPRQTISIRVLPTTMSRSSRGFVPIDLKTWTAKFLKSNPGEKESEVTARLEDTLADYKAGVRCSCGEPIWVIGSAEVGNMCFTCITGEAYPDSDYEIDEAC